MGAVNSALLVTRNLNLLRSDHPILNGRKFNFGEEWGWKMGMGIGGEQRKREYEWMETQAERQDVHTSNVPVPGRMPVIEQNIWLLPQSPAAAVDRGALHRFVPLVFCAVLCNIRKMESNGPSVRRLAKGDEGRPLNT